MKVNTEKSPNMIIFTRAMNNHKNSEKEGDGRKKRSKKAETHESEEQTDSMPQEEHFDGLANLHLRANFHKRIQALQQITPPPATEPASHGRDYTTFLSTYEQTNSNAAKETPVSATEDPAETM